MKPDLRWITPLYGFGSDCGHIGVPESARAALQEMATELVGTTGQVAIYIPLTTPSGYEPGPMCGRVVGTVQLLKMPRGKRMEHYYYDNLEGERQWPIGWPCKAVYAPEISECPSLREHIEYLHGSGTFAHWAARFQDGPFELEGELRERLNRDFAQFEPLG